MASSQRILGLAQLGCLTQGRALERRLAYERAFINEIQFDWLGLDSNFGCS